MIPAKLKLFLFLLIDVSQCRNLFTDEQQQLIQDLVRAEVKDVEVEMEKKFELKEAEMKNRIDELQDVVDFVRNPPTSFFCGSKPSASLLEATITYDKLFYSR